MPRRSQSRTDIPDEQRPPWPDQFTESQYDRPEQMTPEDRALPGHRAYSESGGPEVAGIEGENLEQNARDKEDGDLASSAAETFQAVSGNITENISAASRATAEKASALANTAVNRAQSVTTGVEAFARRRPFSALAGAFLAGIVLVLLGRRKRS